MYHSDIYLSIYLSIYLYIIYIYTHNIVYLLNNRDLPWIQDPDPALANWASGVSEPPGCRPAKDVPLPSAWSKTKAARHPI